MSEEVGEEKLWEVEMLRCFIPGKSQWLDLELLQLSYENESPDAELSLQCL